MVCKDDLQQTCEKDFSVLCPPGFELCSPQKYNNNNRGWNGASPIELLGKIYCRDSGGAGQVYLNGKYTMSLKESLQRDSSLSDCPSTNRGCDRKTSAALCCISTPGKNQRDAYFLKTNSVISLFYNDTKIYIFSLGHVLEIRNNRYCRTYLQWLQNAGSQPFVARQVKDNCDEDQRCGGFYFSKGSRNEYRLCEVPIEEWPTPYYKINSYKETLYIKTGTFQIMCLYL